MKIITRSVEDSYEALLMGEAMEQHGASVFSITVNGSSTHEGALSPHIRYIVWAKAADSSKFDAIDETFSKKLDGEESE